jgi:nucleoside diphosphate kinase
MQLCGIIKSHALSVSEDILQILQIAGIRILEKKFFLFTREHIDVLYDHMSTETRTAIAKHVVGLKGLALLLCAPSIERLLEVVGTESDPRRCAPQTIRARFGVHADPFDVDNDPWWDNAFHRPINEREAVRDLACLFS